MSLTLQLQPKPVEGVPASIPSAWFLSGSSAARWLEELARAGLAEPDTRLFVVPRSTTDQSPAGLLVIPERSATIRGVPAGLECQRIAQGVPLYLPVDARLDPPVTEAELKRLCPWTVGFFHPTLGLTGFDAEATLRVWDLLDRPEERGDAWNEARAGESSLPPLLAIALTRPPSLGDVYGDAKENIGTEPLTDLPPTPQEPKTDAASKARRQLKRLLAKGVSNLTQRLPRRGTGAQQSWLNRLENWAGRQLQAAQGQLEQLRNKELHRLLHLLRNDPESGLRHAISMNQFPHRGRAAPGAHLNVHGLDFDPGKLGGRPADFWSMPEDLQAQLRRLYREMAGRELRQGRHRRAAYIYGELLGDLLSAANALEQGGFFREAALLYDQHLQNPREAARCLAAGGLLSEAIEIYERLELWLEAAELHERLGRYDLARAAIQRVIDDRLTHGDLLGAAKLMEERLRQPEEALALLLSAWPASMQAIKCLRAALELFGRLGRHEAALEQLAQLRREPVPAPLLLPLISVLSFVALNYPDERLRSRSADFTRVLIARQMAQPGLAPDKAGQAIGSLMFLAPEDRLLSSDGNRYLASWRAAQARLERVRLVPAKSGQVPIALRRIVLPRPARWLEARACGPCFFALGHTPTQLKLVRGVWAGNCQSLTWLCPSQLVQQGVVLEVNGDQGRSVGVATMAGPMLEYKTFPTSQAFPGACQAGTPAWLPTLARPFALTYTNAWSVHVASGEAILSCHDRHGELLHTLEITSELLEDAERSEHSQVSLVAIGQGAAVAFGNRLVIYGGNTSLTQLTLPQPIVRLQPTLPHTRPGLAIVMEHGAVLHWLGSPDWVELDRDLPSPLCAFVAGGPLALVSGTHGLLLEVNTRGVQRVASFEPACRTPIKITGASGPGQFALFDADGEVVIYQIPR